MVHWLRFHAPNARGEHWIPGRGTRYHMPQLRSSQLGLVVKNPPTNAGNIREVGSILGSGRSPGGGHGDPLQYSCLENPLDRGVLQESAEQSTVLQRVGYN